MQIGPLEVFAVPADYVRLEDARDVLESAISAHGRQRRRCRLTGKVLESIQDGLNEAIEQQGVDVAPLHRRIYA